MTHETEITIIPLYKCQFCGKEFIKSHNRQVYCCTKCQYYGGLEKTTERVRRYRHRKKELFGYDSVKNLGSGYLGQHRDPDFVKEAVKVRKERNRVKI